MGRQVKEQRTIDGVTYQTERQYDITGRLEHIIYPDTARTQYNYQYNGMGFLKEVRKQGAAYPYINILDTDYNALGQIKNTQYGNGVNTAYAYYEDGSYRLKNITTTKNGTPIQYIHYEFDEAGNIEAMDVTTHTNAQYTVNHDFTYDNLNRLKTATANCTNDISRNYNQGYTYDLAGNMTNKTGIGGWDVLTWESGVNKPRIRPKSVRFDAEVAGIANRNVINNQEQKPVQITYQGSTTNLYYDGAGERIKKVKGTETVIYVGGIFEVRNGQAMSYIYANGQKIVTLANNKEYYSHSDHLGSTGIVTDETGTVVEEIGYLPFGSTLFRNSYNGSTWASIYRFTGQEFDEEYHLYNYNARLYDPIMSRFITPDTIVPDPYNPQSLNRYSYVLNNPLTYIDPSGHEEMTYAEFQAYMDILEYDMKMRELYGGGYNTPYSLGFTTGFETWLFLSGTDFWNMGFAEYNEFLRWKEAGTIVKNIVPKIEKGNMSKVQAIVLHSTDGSTASGAISAFEKTGYGTHYVIDKDGTIYQTANLEKYTYHVGKINSKDGYTTKPWSAIKINDYEIANKNYPQRYPTSSESIGIEIVREHTSKGWEAATKAQLNSLNSLVSSLQTSYNLTSSDIYHHDKISYKTPGEGDGLGY